MPKASLRLYFIHCFAIPAIAFSMYFPGLDVLLSGLYLGLIWKEAKRNSYQLTPGRQGLIAMLWQMPGIFMVLSVCLSWDFSTHLSYYFIFMLELWQTPVLPIISLIPTYIGSGKPLYYYLLMFSVPVLMAVYLVPSFKKEIAPVSTEKFNPLA